MIIYLLITDGKQVLCIKDQSDQFVLPNSKNHWPVTKVRPKTGWPLSLLRHITYGLAGTIGPAYERHRPFGFPVGSSLVIIKMTEIEITNLYNQLIQVRRWAKYNSTDKAFGYRHKLLNSNDIKLSTVDLQSAHGLRFLFPKLGFAESPADTLGPLTNDAR